MRQKNIKYMGAKLFFTAVSLSLLASCATWRKDLRTSGGVHAAIDNCIVDFVKTSKSENKDGIFEVKASDCSRRTYCVTIGAVEKTAWTLMNDSLNSRKGAMYPTCYRIQDNRLFLWHDPDILVSEELLSAMRQYNYIVPSDCSFIEIPGGLATDVYYVSKNDITEYRKTKISGIAPSLKWDKGTSDYSYDWPRYVHGNIPVIIPCKDFVAFNEFLSRRLLVPCLGLTDTLNVGVSFNVSLELPVSDNPMMLDTTYKVELSMLIYSKANNPIKRTTLTPGEIDKMKGKKSMIWNCCDQVIQHWGVYQPYDAQAFINCNTVSYEAFFYLVPAQDSVTIKRSARNN